MNARKGAHAGGRAKARRRAPAFVRGIRGAEIPGRGGRARSVAGKVPAGFHHRALLHLQQQNSSGSRQNVFRRRRAFGEHRRGKWRGHGPVRRARNRHLLRGALLKMKSEGFPRFIQQNFAENNRISKREARAYPSLRSIQAEQQVL